jgi:hypothetical protein
VAFLTKSAQPTPARDAMLARNGARWFYWIAGLSVVNSVVVMTGGTFMMLFGLTSTLAATYIGIDIGGSGAIVGMVVAVLVALGFVGLGWMAERGATWAFATGIAIYVADTAVTVYFRDWFSVVAHAFAVGIVIGGLMASQRLKKAAPPSASAFGVVPVAPTVAGSPGATALSPPPPLSDGAPGFAEAKAPAPLG